MHRLFIPVLLLVSLYFAHGVVDIDNLLTYTASKYDIVASQVPPAGPFPTVGTPTSPTWRTAGTNDWKCGFYSGILWMLYKLTGDSKWRNLAEANQPGLHAAQFDLGTHDLGFIFMSSYGHGLELTGNRNFEGPIVQAATTFSGRFFRLGGVTRSWGNAPGEEGLVKVIIDNLMNLRLFFKADELLNQTYFSSIAISHANRALQEFVRPDGSSYHVVAFNETTGGVERKFTVQGYADNSTWARGQSWGIFAFTELYELTRDNRYLDVAERMALFFMNRLPADYVPYWDFDVPTDQGYTPRDTSAAAIGATGLLNLYKLTGRSMYAGISTLILESLSQNFRSDGRPEYQIPSILVNATGTCCGDADTALNFADYYFLRALDLYRELGLE